MNAVKFTNKHIAKVQYKLVNFTMGHCPIVTFHNTSTQLQEGSLTLINEQ